MPGGSAYTNLRRANRFIAEGVAIADGPYRIRFVSAMEQHRQIEAEIKIRFVSMGINPGDIAAGGIATLDQIRGVPVVAPEKLIRCGKPRAKAQL